MTVSRPLALLTRPRKDSEEVAVALGQRGLDVMIEPLLEIVPLPGVPVSTTGMQGILATSANGIRALAAATPDRTLPVWAVGDATAQTSRALGFSQVEAAGGDVNSLAALVIARCDPCVGSLLHVAGTVVAGDLSGLLRNDGFSVSRVVLYEAKTPQALSNSLKNALREKRLRCALFFSPRTAATFATLVGYAGLRGETGEILAYALSRAVARELEVLPWKGMRVASLPSQAALLAVLDEDFGQP